MKLTVKIVPVVTSENTVNIGIIPLTVTAKSS